MITKTKVRDVALQKGDWFILNGVDDITARNKYSYIHLYKVIDDRKESYNGFSSSIIVEKYSLDYEDILDENNNNFKIIKEGKESFDLKDLKSSHTTIFNSVEEAFNWLERQIKLLNANIKDNDLTKTDMERLFHTFGSSDHPITDKYFSYYLKFYGKKLYLWLNVAFFAETMYGNTYDVDYHQEIPLDDKVFSNCEDALTNLLINAQNDLFEIENIFYNIRNSLKSYK